jgi:2-keto-4-pentenoate hydratase/2-oxohepta-3-ene-1,7-dioic acid hydratase in catechol pathway
MKLVSVGRGDAKLGCIVGAEILVVAEAGLGPDLPGSMAALLAGGEGAIRTLGRLVDQTMKDEGSLAALRARAALQPLAGALLQAPVQPRLIICTGRAYRAHRREMGIGHLPAGRPGGFIKNANAVTGPDMPILIPPSAPDMVDFEGEIAAVFHTECHRVTADRAWQHIAGLTLSNDVSARNWVALAGRTGNSAPNLLGKQFPTFFPVGPCVATLDEFDDIDAVDMTTTVNGELMQSSTTADLIWPAAELIAHYSQFYLFKPGDMVTFGTPHGVGYGRSPQRFLTHRDVVTVRSAAIGALRNTLQAVDPSAPALGIVGNEEEQR